MGKNLKGKECGKGICQRKDGLYFARFYAKMVRVKMDISKRCPKQKNGLLTQSMKIHII